MPLETGQLLENKYRIVRLIGEGGMGAVYEGENTRVRKRVAIKVLQSTLAASQNAIERFEHEAQAAGQIGSDHIMEVYDLGELDGGDSFMVMEYLDGETLGNRIERLTRMTPAQLVPIFRQVCAGLHAAHGVGIIHRDLKPENIFILKEKAGRADFVKIIDFGISKFQALSASGMKMTRTGAVMGTPFYMSPEQARGGDVDTRSDVYALGVILYEALTNQVPFRAGSFNELMFKIVLSDPKPPSEIVDDLDPAFETLVLKSMAKIPGDRFASIKDLSDALADWAASGMPVTVRPNAPSEEKIAHVMRGEQPSSSGLEAMRESGMLSTPPASVDPAVGDGEAELRVTTADSWAASQSDAQSAGKRSIVPLVVGLVVAAALVAGGGAFLAMRLLPSGGDASTPSADAAAAVPVDAVESTRPPAKPAEPVVAPVDVPVEEKAKTGPAGDAAEKKHEPAKPRPVVAPTVRPNRIVRPKPVAKKPTVTKPTDRKPTAAPAKPTGPPKRKKRDFGY